MSWFYRTMIRPVLFAQDSEEVHNRVLETLAWGSRNEIFCDVLGSFHSAPETPVTAFGLRFPNPVGLAAGMDKCAAAVPAWEAMGFGFTELGGVTWHAQEGNPAPRMFRAVADEALVNRMGFNNPGAEAIAGKLAEWRAMGRWPKHPVGINLGKSKITPLEKAAEDYASSFRALWPHADFFVVNVSSPNTPNLRQLQDKAALDGILAGLHDVNRDCASASGVPAKGGRRSGRPLKPIIVKVAPDLSLEALDEIVEVVAARNVAGIVATNTTTERPETTDSELKKVYAESGGLSGRPVRSRSTEVIRHLYQRTKGQVPIIGVGGVFNADDAWEKITAGATLVQVYTGLVYEGPGIAAQIVAGLRQRLVEAGLNDLKEAVGMACNRGGGAATKSIAVPVH